MTNEDTESLWNFWDVDEREEERNIPGGGMAAPTTTTTTCEDEEDHNDDSEKSSEEEIIEDVEHAKEENVRIVRYNARGHGYSSPAETSLRVGGRIKCGYVESGQFETTHQD